MNLWRMVCIGQGPGPKNVLAEDVHGYRMCVPYAIWKHKLSKETYLSDQTSQTRKTYVTAIGSVQAFSKDGVKQPAVREFTNSGNDTCYSLTIRTGSQVLLGVTLWPELAHVGAKIKEGFGVIVEGEYTEENKNGTTFRNVSARNLVVIPCVDRQEREVVNAVPNGAEVEVPTSAFQF